MSYSPQLFSTPLHQSGVAPVIVDSNSQAASSHDSTSGSQAQPHDSSMEHVAPPTSKTLSSSASAIDFR